MVMQDLRYFRAKIVDVQPKNLTIEITGNESKVSKFIKLMEKFRASSISPHGQGRDRAEIASRPAGNTVLSKPVFLPEIFLFAGHAGNPEARGLASPRRLHSS